MTPSIPRGLRVVDDHHETVLRTAHHPGYVQVGATGRVCRRDPTDLDFIDPVTRSEHDTVADLLTTGALTHGEGCRVIPRHPEQFANAVSVRADTIVIPRYPRPPVRRVLVTGSRTWTDPAPVRATLADAWSRGARTLVVGACPQGADALAEACWRAWGGLVERHPADWTRHGRAAGFRRNADMVTAGADLCAAFIDRHSAGATHTARLAEQAGIPTRRYHQ